MHGIDSARRDAYYEPAKVTVRRFPGVQDVALNRGLSEALRRPCRSCGEVGGDHVPGCGRAWPTPPQRTRVDVPVVKPCRSCKWIFDADRVLQHAPDCRIAHPRPKTPAVDRINGASGAMPRVGW